MEQKILSIYDFKKGDIIVRIEPSKSYGTNLFTGEETKDRSYIGDKLSFVGIANGMIYLDRDEKEKAFWGDDYIELPVDKFENGWVHYIDPKELFKDNIKASNIPLHVLKERLAVALDQENYEEAAKLKKEIASRKIK